MYLPHQNLFAMKKITFLLLLLSVMLITAFPQKIITKPIVKRTTTSKNLNNNPGRQHVEKEDNPYDTTKDVSTNMGTTRVRTNTNKDGVMQSYNLSLYNGYETMQIFARINSTDAELEVKINGRVVGRYTQTSKVTLDGFFKRNAINVVSFKFSTESNANYVELSGKLPGSADWIAIFNFNSKPGKTEEQFEVPFIGKTNKQPAGYDVKTDKEPVENGYESIKIFLRINNDEQMEVKVNGRIVGRYTQTVGVNLDDFLRHNAMNAISFNFSTESKESYVELSGKFPGNGDFIPIYNFNPKPGKTEGTSEFMFAGVNKPVGKPIKGGWDVKTNKKV